MPPGDLLRLFCFTKMNSKVLEDENILSKERKNPTCDALSGVFFLLGSHHFRPWLSRDRSLMDHDDNF